MVFVFMNGDMQFDGYTSEIVEIQEGNDDTLTRGQISTAKLLLTIDTINLVDQNNKVGTVYVDACSMYKLGDYGAIADEVTTPATASDGGLGWYLSIGEGTMELGTNRGAASIVLKPEIAFTAGSKHCNMYYTYAHQILGASISMAPSGPSVNITSGNYDYQTVMYRY